MSTVLLIQVFVGLICFGPIVYLTFFFIREELKHRRRMRELDELEKKQDLVGLLQWGEDYRKGKR